ncbi:tetratricopeptide repeat protein [Apilactobacillus bombintestini]|uniref:Uncharacterized protein n=1 Tax=Apilactobacillus bombintestini TaxID=2419772 RepID=A0A387ANB5_9LACO|nr:tetratricopeptide repeat protein [Apilactobacillus bombintestini]AYF92164.1 hypothetical protein D7I45_00990 [Apilactobacillus bombintestini]
MEELDLGKDNTKQLNKFMELALKSSEADKRDETIALLSSAISLYPANAITAEELNGSVPSRSEVLTKLGMLFTNSAANLDPTGIHLFQQALVYNPDYVSANFYLGKILLNNGNIAEAHYYLERAFKNTIENDRFYGPVKKMIDETVNKKDLGDPIFAVDYLIGQAVSHTLVENPIGTFKKMSFDKIENKYDANVQMFPTEESKQKLDKIREFNSNHGFKQESFDEFLPANLPLFEENNQLSVFLGEGYTLVDEGAEIYDVCGLNVDTSLSFTCYKLIKNDTDQLSYLLLAGKSPLELKERKLRENEASSYGQKIFDVYKNQIIFNEDALPEFMTALAKDYFNDQFTAEDINNILVNGIKDITFNQSLDIHEKFQLNDSRIKILIDTNQKA